MARTREFDEQRVLDRALQLFWQRGYKATSLDELLVAMSLSKSSFYGAFGSKRELLVAALNRYADLLMQGPAAALLRPAAGRREIEQTFAAVAAHARTRNGQRGCFVNNCLSELAAHDSVVLAATRAARQRLQDGLCGAVRQGQRDGTITAGESAEALSCFLVNMLAGINLAAKAGPDRTTLDATVRVALRALDPATTASEKTHD